MEDSDRRWSFGPSLWSEEKTVYGIPTQRITNTKEIQKQSLLEKPCWLYYVLQWAQNTTLKTYTTMTMTMTTTTHIQKIMRNGVEINGILLQQHNARPHTSAAITDAIGGLGFTVLPNQPTVQILLPAISTYSPNWRKTSGSKTSALMKKSRPQHANGFRKTKIPF